MAKIGLALSGGGFRATLFHLGVVRFLKDIGKLSEVTDIASVSGGSIFAAHLTLNWDRYTGTDEEFDEAIGEIVRFVQSDVRNYVVRRMPLQFPWRIIAKLTRRSTRNLTPNAVLEQCYERWLYGDTCLYELLENPKLHILATSVSNGGLSVFNRDGLFVQQRSEDKNARFDHIPGTMASIPRVVGASSAFPGFFPPVEFTAADLGVRDGEFPTEFFTDGGVYDNLGIRAFSWLNQNEGAFDEIYVSDAGKPFQILSDNALGFIGQSVRASDILWDRVWQLERENFGKQTGFIFLPITETVSAEESPTLHPVIQAEVQTIRTDLDRFSDEEINALAQHGYEVTRKIFRQTHGPIDVPEGEGWAPIPASRLPGLSNGWSRKTGPAPPTEAARKLRASATRRIWSTLFDWRDWPSYLYVAVAVFVFGFLPLQIYKLYKHSQVQQTVIDSIADGHPDIRRILQLIDTNPLRDWSPDAVETIDVRGEPDHSGVQIKSYTRIIDLRNWRPEKQDPQGRGGIYIIDRVDLMLPEGTAEASKINSDVTFSYPSIFNNLEFRQPDQRFPATIRRLSEPVMDYGEKRTLYEVEYHLNGLPRGEPATVEMEFLARIDQALTRAPFVNRFATDLLAVWILFPDDRPYQNYDLVSYPADKSEPPTVMNSRYRINHPYGSLIGWSVVNPAINQVYECRWTNQ
ncbi:patatin-like phospholipase family protein [Calycomorphotria hydatis]|uniref:Patatin-like phospholipase n=1 Tax=Calycomorphotria hydatis TaxID=2528027 RepID=A0A517TC78_9PLAN|nr:patatin-like phospholipase family protein [Calycomorphotria hydatis]QDT65987.1 Patatin-like phospholipase [Calycomorphotria hydatis]